MKYEVGVSARKVGAIGIWSAYQFKVEALNVEDAKEEGRKAAYAAGLDHVTVSFVLLSSG